MVHATARIAPLLAAGLLALSLSGCGGSGSGVTPGAGTGGAVSQNGTDTAGTGDAAELVSTKCTLCHTIDRVEGAQKSRDQWTVTVGRMQRNGLVVTDEEKAAIIEYLSSR